MTHYTGSCHCGSVQFEFDSPGGLQDLKRCNCSLCKRKGAIIAAMPVGALRITQGADKLTLYQWNLNIARHYFCSSCGIYTHHQRRSNPLEIGVNVGCIDDIDPAMLEHVGLGDGASLSLGR